MKTAIHSVDSGWAFVVDFVWVAGDWVWCGGEGVCGVRAGESRERWRYERAWCRTSRCGLTHWEVRVRKTGDQ